MSPTLAMMMDLQGRMLQMGRDADDGSNNNPNSATNAHQETYEFIAFLLWYIFLIVCCVLPTCCAYRRRRMVESRLAEQQQQQAAMVNRLQQGNFFILSHLHSQRNHERIRQERTRMIGEELKLTTMKVANAEQGILEAIDDSAHSYDTSAAPTAPENSEQQTTARREGQEQASSSSSLPPAQPKDSEDPEDQPASEQDVNQNDSRKNNNHSSSSLNQDASEGADVSQSRRNSASRKEANSNHSLYSVSEEQILQDEYYNSASLQLPSNAVNGNRAVPGLCSICLCKYETGESISWSTESACQHAFHTECIIPWLAKKPEPQCPVCRQEFCPPVQVSSGLAGLAGLAAGLGESGAGVMDDLDFMMLDHHDDNSNNNIAGRGGLDLELGNFGSTARGRQQRDWDGIDMFLQQHHHHPQEAIPTLRFHPRLVSGDEASNNHYNNNSGSATVPNARRTNGGGMVSSSQDSSAAVSAVLESFVRAIASHYDLPTSASATATNTTTRNSTLNRNETQNNSHNINGNDDEEDEDETMPDLERQTVQNVAIHHDDDNNTFNRGGAQPPSTAPMEEEPPSSGERVNGREESEGNAP